MSPLGEECLDSAPLLQAAYDPAMWRACALTWVATVGIGELCCEILLQLFLDMKKKACDRFAISKGSRMVYEPKPQGFLRG
jgi:hypothetical protein